jgi:hypothetical protein
VRVGGCSGSALASGSTVMVRENLTNVCLTLLGTGFSGVTGGVLRMGSTELGTILGATSATSVNLVFSTPAQLLPRNSVTALALEVCLDANSQRLGCAGGLSVSPITASASGMAGNLGTETSPFATLSDALAVATFGSTVHVLGGTAWGPTDTLTLPADAHLMGSSTATLNGQGNASRVLQLSARSNVTSIRFTGFTGRALQVNNAGTATDVTLSDVALVSNAVSLDIEQGGVVMRGGSMLRDGTGTTGIRVRAQGGLFLNGVTLGGNRGDAVLVKGGMASLTNVTGTSHLASTGSAGDDDAYLTLSGGTATVTSSSFAGSQRSAITVKGTGNTLTVGGGTSFTNNGTMNQAYCTGIAVLGQGTTRVDQSLVQMPNVFTDSCVGVYRAPTADNEVHVSASQFVRSSIQLEGNLQAVELFEVSVVNVPWGSGVTLSAPDTGTLRSVSIRNPTLTGNAHDGISAQGMVRVRAFAANGGTCNISNNLRHGISSRRGTLTVEDCTVSTNAAWGVLVEDPVSTSVLTRNQVANNGTATATSSGGVLLQGGTANLTTNSITGSRGPGIRLEGGTGSAPPPSLSMNEAHTITGNTGHGLEAFAGSVTLNNGPNFSSNGGSGVAMLGATTLTATAPRLRNNAQDGLRVDRFPASTVTLNQFDIGANGGAGIRLTGGGSGGTGTMGTISLNGPTPCAGTCVKQLESNGIGHIVDDTGFNQPLSVQWTVNLGTNVPVTGPGLAVVGSRWTQVNIDGVTITHDDAMAPSLDSARLGSAPPSPKRIKLTGTIRQNGSTFTVPSPPLDCGPGNNVSLGSPLRPFMRLAGSNDCIEP